MNDFEIIYSVGGIAVIILAVAVIVINYREWKKNNKWNE